MANNVEQVTSLVIILSIIIISLLIAIYEYFRNLRGISVRKEFIDQFYPILISQHPLDLSNSDNSFIQFTRKQVSNENEVLVPENLLAHTFILNPIRLAVLRILYHYHRYISSDLRKDLNIPWGTYTPHIKALTDEGFIITREEFVDDKALKVLYLEEKGRLNFNDLQKTLKTVIK